MFSGSAHPELAAEICADLGEQLRPVRLRRFANDCIEVQLQSNCRERDVFLIQPLCAPVQENLVELLERRLDAVIYRMKFAITVFASRQLVSHGHVKVNGKRVNIASYLVKDNDVIELTSKAKEMLRVLEATQTAERDVPEYVTADHKDMKGTYVRGPKLADVPYPVQMEPSLVVEYYSR